METKYKGILGGTKLSFFKRRPNYGFPIYFHFLPDYRTAWLWAKNEEGESIGLIEERGYEEGFSNAHRKNNQN